jgi:glucose-1-phosphate cytidylyltransferase
VKCIILAGGFGTRITEETSDRPKPMVEINGKPILWHIMNIYARQGCDDFVVATGYKSEVIKSWISGLSETWKIQDIYTGLNTQTGGRIFECIKSYPKEPKFFLTYGDGLANINLSELYKSHLKSKKIVTVTAVRPPARFGYLKLRQGKLHRNLNTVSKFGEKEQLDEGWINGGYFVLNREVETFLGTKISSFELDALPHIAKSKQLNAHLHHGFWKPMDTLREKLELEELARNESIPWLASS